MIQLMVQHVINQVKNLEIVEERHILLSVELTERHTWTNVLLIALMLQRSIQENAKDKNYSVNKCVPRKASQFVKEEKCTETFVMLFAMDVQLRNYMTVVQNVIIIANNSKQFRNVVVLFNTNLFVEVMVRFITTTVTWHAMAVNRVLILVNAEWEEDIPMDTTEATSVVIIILSLQFTSHSILFTSHRPQFTNQSIQFLNSKLLSKLLIMLTL